MASTQQAKDIFLQALEQESGAKRQRFLVEACGDDLQLRHRVDSLLAAHDKPESCLDRPAVDRRHIESAELNDNTDERS